MRKLVYLNSAQRDLADILEYITVESGSLKQGREFIGALRAQCRKLAFLPLEMGRSRPELRPEIRSFAFRNYVIFFRYRPERFEVVNLIERHRDVVALFGDGDNN